MAEKLADSPESAVATHSTAEVDATSATHTIAAPTAGQLSAGSATGVSAATRAAAMAAAHGTIGTARLNRLMNPSLGPDRRAPSAQPVETLPIGAAEAVRAPTGGQPLDTSVRGSVERAVGADLGHVRVHTGPAASSAAESLSARAFTSGKDIFLGPGESATDTRLIAHEAAHVVQGQRDPKVRRYTPTGGDEHEVQARRVEAAAVKETRSGPDTRAGAAQVNAAAVAPTAAPGDDGGILGAIRRRIAGIVGGLQTGWTALTRDAVDAVAVVQERTRSASSGLTSIAEGAIAGVQGMWSTARTTAAGLAQGLTSTLGRALSGLTGAVGAVKQALLKLDAGALSAARSATRPHQEGGFIAPGSTVAMSVTDSDLSNHRRWVSSGGTTGERLIRRRAKLREVDLTGVALSQARLLNVDLAHVQLTGADLSDADLLEAVLNEVVLREANLQGARLGGAYILNCDLTAARLDGADLAKAQLHHVDLSRASLRRARLVRTEAYHTSFTEVDLSEADLSNALLSEPDLRGADISSAVLDGASLTGARIWNLRGTPASAAGIRCDWVDVAPPGQVPQREGPEMLQRITGC
jgi:uncharacterized protein YjbI with pentapeptide repeats